MNKNNSANYNRTYKMVLCGLFTALTAIGAFIQVPVPHLDYFTLQFFFVLLAGMLLGSRLGAAAVGSYVFIGLIGVPIFAAGGGPAYVLRPSFGYLVGFILAAWAAGAVITRFRSSGKTAFANYMIAALAGFLVTYGIGIIYKYMILRYYMGEPLPLWVIFASCFPLDIPGDLVLCVIASIVASRLEPARRRYL